MINPLLGYEEHIGIPDPEFDEFNTKKGKETKIKDYFNDTNTKAIYVYDFGDNWRHTIKFEGQFDADPKKTYPACLKGKNACPPEDVGGIWGYEDFLKTIADPKHVDYKNMKEWVGEDFNPNDFDSNKIIFDDPKARWDMSLNEN
jgi:hypothetical protein